MPRRVSLPGAEELFGGKQPPEQQRDARAEARDGEPTKPSKPSGRVRHDEKITVYVTADELMHLEQTRLRLRSEHGLAVDRGRIVRAAIHLALHDYEERGDDSALTERLREQ